ncbi:protein SENSITIVE TO UV 2-like isoform X1 [Arachis hypogaea]|nr:uncharacterized protein LOC112747468 isoform X1 [Arachis hypogaea]XP_025697941.1 uncharacterized protein LOC112800076 isoform X1 [Arachis hypogaea]
MDIGDDIFFDDWEDAMLNQLIQAEELVLSSIAKPTQQQQQQQQPPPQLPQPPPPHSVCEPLGFSPPRELSQRAPDFDSFPLHHRHHQHHSPPRPAKPSSHYSYTSSFSSSGFASAPPRPQDSDKDIEIERLKTELGRASNQLANMEKECLMLIKERDKKEEQLRLISLKNEEAIARANCSKSVDKPDNHKFSSFENGMSSKDPSVEKTFKSKGVETDMVSHQEAQASLSNAVPAYLDLSQKLLAIQGTSVGKRLGSNAISKLLVCCHRYFHTLFGFMSMSLPSEIQRKLLSDISSSGRAIQYLKDCFHTAEAAKVSHLYLVLTKVNDGTYVLENMIEPLLDLCSMENVVIVQSSLFILHNLLKFLLEESKINSGRRDNVYTEQICIEKKTVDSIQLESVKDGTLFNEEVLSRKECWNLQNAPPTHVNWLNLFETMHQIVMRIKEESVRVEAVSIINMVLLKSNAYFERAQFNQNILFKTISGLLKKDAGLIVRRHALRLLYLALNCPNLLATFCCGCREGESTSAMDGHASVSDFKDFGTILQGLGDCVASCGGGLLELKLSRNAILVLAFLASSGKPGFEIFIGHRLSRGVTYLMLILQLLVSEVDHEARVGKELSEISRERTILMREILILLNRLVSNPSYSATVLRSLSNTRDMAGLTVDVAIRLSRKINECVLQDSMVKHIRETEIVDLARVFKKRVFTYLGDDLL